MVAAVVESHSTRDEDVAVGEVPLDEGQVGSSTREVTDALTPEMMTTFKDTINESHDQYPITRSTIVKGSAFTQVVLTRSVMRPAWRSAVTGT